MSNFEEVRKCYTSLPETIRDKYRGRFTPIIDELEIYEQLRDRGFSVTFKSGQGSFDLLVNGKTKVEVKSCNTDNNWVKSGNWGAGSSGIKPELFDILVYVEFDDSLKRFEHYVFTSEQAKMFPLSSKEKSFVGKRHLKAGSTSRTLFTQFETKYIDITQAEADRLNRLVQDSRNGWVKLTKAVLRAEVKMK